MGMHTGEAEIDGDRYVGISVHRAQRICAAAHGGQVLLSATTSDVVADDLPPVWPSAIWAPSGSRTSFSLSACPSS